MKDVKKASDAKVETEALVKREKTLDTQQKLDNIDGSQKEKVKTRPTGAFTLQNVMIDK